MKLTALPMCLLFIVGLTLSSFGDVLCVSDSGHIKVKSVRTPCCDEAVTTCFFDASDYGHEHHDSCDNCSDLPLENPKIHQRYSNADFGSINSSLTPLYLLNQNINQTISNINNRTIEHSRPNSKEFNILLSTTILIC